MKFTYKTGDRPLDGYKINRGVGVGGFGEVYFATSDAGKEVALKRVQRNLDVEVRGVRQCLNLKHPNLVALYDLKYDEEGQAWVVMEYVPGDSLKDVLDRNPHGIPQVEVDRWFHEIASGVAYLHDHGIVHRDLKPGNIFDDAGAVKIGDYGLSKFIAASRRSGQTESVGTCHYMAPEIGKGVYGKEIDIYALGIILYEMLTGRVPFDGETSHEIIMKHLTDNPDLAGVGEPYRTVIQQALRKDPEKRFRSVAEMLERLASRGGEQVASQPRPAVRPEAIYIGDDERDEGGAPEMVFGQLRHHEVVVANAVPPVRFPSTRRPCPPRHAATVARTPRGAHCPSHRTIWGTMLKAALVLLLIALLAHHPKLLLLVAIGALVYAAFRLGQHAYRRRATAAASPGNPLGEPGSPVWRTEVRHALQAKPVGERFFELTGSMLFSAVTASVLVLVALLLHGETLDGSVAGWATYTWLTVTSIAGCWVLLALGKFWEGDDGDHFVRRIVMLLAGLGIGAIAYGAAWGLMVDLPDLDRWTAHTIPHERLVDRLYSPEGAPLAAAYLVYFAGLFGVLRWWTQTDPLRRRRLSLAATALCLLAAWIMHMFCQFPQPWGLMLAATISVATQLSAPWINPRQAAKVRAAV